MSSGEDPFTKLLGTLLGWLLLIYGVCWVIRWLLTKIAENIPTLVGVGLVVAGGIALVAFAKVQVRAMRDRRLFMKSAGPVLQQLEEELSEKQAAMADGGWERELNRLEAKLAANRG